MTEPADQLSVWAARKGDQRAARALFDRYLPLVMSYCMISCGRDRDRAKDLAQETFARAFRHLHALEDADRFRPWLMTIARNVCRSSAVSEAQRRRLLEEAAVELELSPEDDQDREERIATVKTLLESLPDDELKEIVMMRYSEPEHSTRQISEQLGVPHGTVTVKLMRFRAAIKKRILRALVELEGAAT